MVEKCSIIGHFVIIVIVCWWIENDGKFPFFERILPLLGTQYISNYAFGEEDESKINFVMGVSIVDAAGINKDELIKLLSFGRVIAKKMRFSKAFLH